MSAESGPDAWEPAGPVRVWIEVPRGSLVKRGSEGQVEFISPVPCPFNYGSVRSVRAADGDAQDALVLGPCRPHGSSHELLVRARVLFVDEGLADHKWVCSDRPLTRTDELALKSFFRVYGGIKAVYDTLLRKPRPTRYMGFEHAPGQR